MARLKARTKRISLDFMGEAWNEAFVEFQSLTYADSQKLQGKFDDAQAAGMLMDMLKTKFVAGTSLGADDELVDLTADDLAELDIETIGLITKELAGSPSPNA